ncbi:MAG: T9SS type A sorting domain-containing protein [Bacteroidota bacterium]
MRRFSLFHLAATGSLLCFLFLLPFSYASGERSVGDKSPQIVLSQHIGLNNKVFLSWEANAEVLPKYWVVERAKINGSFQAIQRVKVDEPLIFVDESPWPSARYRVKAVWSNGEQKVSNHVAWRSLSLYFPLEAKTEDNQLFLSFPLIQDKMLLCIYDENGKRVSNQVIKAFSKSCKLETQAFSEGVYILEVQYQEQVYRTRWRKY